MRKQVFPLIFSLLAVLFITVAGCRNHRGSQYRISEEQTGRDWPQIRESGKLIALTDFNSTDYFIYRGEPMGYQFELLKALSQYLNVDLEIRVDNDLERSFRKLEQGQCDVLAINLTVTRERKKIIRFTDPIGQTRQVLVQRKPKGWRRMTLDAINRALIRNTLDLAGKTVYVQKNSSYAERLRNLMDEIGDTIIVEEVDVEAERLIKMVADGEIDYTVADENVAKVNSTYYSDLDVETAISFPQNLAWALRKENTDHLLYMINSWIDSYRKTLDYAMIYKKYFKNPKSKLRVKSDYFVLGNGRISPYDKLIKQGSDSLGWDWRLLASMIYQESHFDPGATSWAGAMGLMQIMPSTVKQYHVKNPFDPEENIRTGVEFLKWINSIFDETVLDEQERIKFILASYNTGQGHVKDAMRLAEKYGEDKTLWDVTRKYLLKLSEEKYFLDPVVKYGYCRGDEPVNYVDQILDRYKHYKNIVRE